MPELDDERPQSPDDSPGLAGKAVNAAATATSVVKDVAAGAAAGGGVPGAVLGAGKAALKLAAQSPKGRKALVAVAAAAILGPFVVVISVVMAISNLTSVSLSASDQAANSSLVSMVQQTGFSQEEMDAIVRASGASGIQWEVLAAVLYAQEWAADGDGPYHINSSVSGQVGDPDDIVKASTWVAARIRAALDSHWINPTLDIGNGATVFSDKTIAWADEDAHKQLIVGPYSDALAELPLDGADEDWGDIVIDQAVNWRLGIIDADLGYCAPEGDSLTVQSSKGEQVTLNSKMLGYAETIYQEGIRAGINDNGLQSAFMTVLVETRFKNLASAKQPGSEKYPNDGVVGGDHLSIGLFQQQPWWGSIKNRMDPGYAARAYFGKAGLKGVPGVLQISGWQTMDPGDLAQAVQRSAGGWYFLWKNAGAEILAKVKGITCDTGDFSGSWSGVIQFALSKVGVYPYSWGGGGLNGPSYGIGSGAHIYGFDCSGFVQFVVYQGSGKHVALPGDSRSQARWLASKGVVHRTSRVSDLKAGDIVFFSHGGSIGSIYHVALVTKAGWNVEEPGQGRRVQHNQIKDRMPYDLWGYARFDLMSLANK